MTFSEFTKQPIPVEARRLKKQTLIETLEGDMIGNKGDWLIKGIKGELYPCKDEIFRESYRPTGKDKCDYCAFGGQERRPCDAYEVCTFEWRCDAP